MLTRTLPSSTRSSGCAQRRGKRESQSQGHRRTCAARPAPAPSGMPRRPRVRRSERQTKRSCCCGRRRSGCSGRHVGHGFASAGFTSRDPVQACQWPPSSPQGRRRIVSLRGGATSSRSSPPAGLVDRLSPHRSATRSLRPDDPQAGEGKLASAVMALAPGCERPILDRGAPAQDDLRSTGPDRPGRLLRDSRAGAQRPGCRPYADRPLRLPTRRFATPVLSNRRPLETDRRLQRAGSDELGVSWWRTARRPSATVIPGPSESDVEYP